MMIGVAQVIGMKPTLSFVFSGLPRACAKASLAAPSGKNCEIAASAVQAPTALQEGAAGVVLRDQGAHDRQFDHAGQAPVACQRAAAWVVLRLARVSAAAAAGRLQGRGSIERILKAHGPHLCLPEAAAPRLSMAADRIAGMHSNPHASRIAVPWMRQIARDDGVRNAVLECANALETSGSCTT